MEGGGDRLWRELYCNPNVFTYGVIHAYIMLLYSDPACECMNRKISV